MELKDKIFSDMKLAMKEKDKFKLSVIRMLRSEIQNMDINNSNEVTEDDIYSLVTKEIKKRKESIADYEQGGREDVVNDINREIDILSDYLPPQLTETELREIVKNTIQESGASSKKEMGKVMGKVMPEVKGKADGDLVRQLVSEYLE